jgi:hypothetical protein
MERISPRNSKQVGCPAAKKQAGVNMDKDVAEKYCQCSLEIVMERYENDEKAGEAIASMSVNRVQQILVLPCIQ